MRSSEEDLTTRARIRDAAIDLFPREGFAGTTIRAIAADAGVSPALVLHHFGSKEGLHRVCDEHVIRTMGESKRETMRSGSYKEAGAVASAYQMVEPVLRYLAWTLSTSSETAARIFDDLVEDVTAQLIEGQESGLIQPFQGDPRKQAAVLVVMQVGSLVLHEHLGRAMDADMLSAEGLMASAPYALRVLSGRLFNPEVLADADRALSDLESEPIDEQESER